MKFFVLILLSFAILIAGCDQVDFTAPAGSTLTLSATPPAINANGISTLTAVGVRGGGSGAPLPDDTAVTFTTTLGTITPNPAMTQNGVATATLHAGSQSGTASVAASSGDIRAEAIEIVIGEARPVNIVLSANPSNLPISGGKVVLRARVTDADGNPIQGVAVIFETTTGTLRSGSRAIRTDSNGVADDNLDATIDAMVTATTSNAISDTVEIDVGGAGPATCDFAISPTDPKVDETVFFTDASLPGAGNPPIVEFLWDFGDGSQDSGQSVEHEYTESGTFVVVHTIVDSQGFSSVCTQTITVVGLNPICAFSFSPTNAQAGEPITFDASSSSDDVGIVSFEWNFDDGTQAIVTNPITTHTYSDADVPGPGKATFNVSLVVTDDDENFSTCTLPVTVAPSP
jgi:PKD domain/Bacterial Ig-like domain (group 1)